MVFQSIITDRRIQIRNNTQDNNAHPMTRNNRLKQTIVELCNLSTFFHSRRYEFRRRYHH